mmetsp:Transcript_77019/g.186063  ORF Transcript_77019/g.186063 Transcript_77019/m.186063 type:complete len:373 (-) Transcript_77019:307-1425(-)
MARHQSSDGNVEVELRLEAQQVRLRARRVGQAAVVGEEHVRRVEAGGVAREGLQVALPAADLGVARAHDTQAHAHAARVLLRLGGAATHGGDGGELHGRRLLQRGGGGGELLAECVEQLLLRGSEQPRHIEGGQRRVKALLALALQALALPLLELAAARDHLEQLLLVPRQLLLGEQLVLLGEERRDVVGQSLAQLAATRRNQGRGAHHIDGGRLEGGERSVEQRRRLRAKVTHDLAIGHRRRPRCEPLLRRREGLLIAALHQQALAHGRVARRRVERGARGAPGGLGRAAQPRRLEAARQRAQPRADRLERGGVGGGLVGAVGQGRDVELVLLVEGGGGQARDRLPRRRARLAHRGLLALAHVQQQQLLLR